MEEISFWIVLRTIVDIGIISFILYQGAKLVKSSKALRIVNGVIVILLLWVISNLLGLVTVKWLLSQIILYGLLGLLIIFQPELRNALEKLGESSLKFSKRSKSEVGNDTIEDLVKACMYLSKRKIGALIAIENEDSLEVYEDTGIHLGAKVSDSLIESIFVTSAPLHDGAVVIRGDLIESATCYLPLTDRPDIPKELGTRHRAAIGLTELVDATVLVVSEETGSMSIVKNGQIFRNISGEELRNHLEIIYSTPQNKELDDKWLLWKKKEVKNDE